MAQEQFLADQEDQDTETPSSFIPHTPRSFIPSSTPAKNLLEIVLENLFLILENH